jgi:hypothetical protein
MTDELGGTTDAMIGMKKLNLEAFDAAYDQQNATAKGTDGTLQNVEAMKSQLAALSDSVKMQLMNAGGLGLMMSIIQKLTEKKNEIDNYNNGKNAVKVNPSKTCLIQ